MVTASASAEPSSTSSVRDYVELMKPGIMSLVVFTGAVGMILAPGQQPLFLQSLAILCIALGSGAASAMNMWYDRDIDRIMKRTAGRPIPAGRVPAEEALALGIVLSVLSVLLMGLATNWLAGGLLAISIAYYVVIYTMWLKRRTPQNIVIGGAAGAFPPVIGWAASSGSLTLEPLLLFLIIFLWTPPHFWALAIAKNDDYKRANIPMMPLTAGTASTKKQIWAYSWLLAFSALAPFALGLKGLLYGALSVLLSALFLWHAWRVLRGDDMARCLKLFAYSILYLFALFTAMVLDHALARIYPLSL